MSDFFEIDFLDVESGKSGDAIPLRYRLNGVTEIHVVDGGFQDTGDKVIDHIRKYYDNPDFINRVVASHPDGDHAGGLRTVLEKFEVRELWMLRPWLYADEIIDRFSRFTSVENLKKRLRDIYPNKASLEEIAKKRGIPIYEPYQGTRVGEFFVMAPTKNRYLDLIVESERTPEATKEQPERELTALGTFADKAAKKEVALVKSAWGVEVFSEDETSAENGMSVIQYANLFGHSILLTADASREGLVEGADYAPSIGLTLPGIDYFQIPHHGSRRNVSTKVLDRWLGPCLPSKPAKGETRFTAIISAARKDEDHPRKSVVRAVIHRGAKVVSTERSCLSIYHNAPVRDGWIPANALPYPEDQED